LVSSRVSLDAYCLGLVSNPRLGLGLGLEFETRLRLVSVSVPCLVQSKKQNPITK